MNTARQRLKLLYLTKEAVKQDIISATKEYIEECGSKPLLYFTEHSIVRYLERVTGTPFNKKFNDVEKLASYHIAPEKVRQMMLTHDEQKQILLNTLSKFEKGNVIFTIKGLSVITVTIRNK